MINQEQAIEKMNSDEKIVIMEIHLDDNGHFFSVNLRNEKIFSVSRDGIFCDSDRRRLIYPYKNLYLDRKSAMAHFQKILETSNDTSK